MQSMVTVLMKIKLGSQKIWRTPEEQAPLNQLSEAQMDSESEAASIGPTWICLKASVDRL